MDDTYADTQYTDDWMESLDNQPDQNTAGQLLQDHDDYIEMEQQIRRQRLIYKVHHEIQITLFQITLQRFNKLNKSYIKPAKLKQRQQTSVKWQFQLYQNQDNSIFVGPHLLLRDLNKEKIKFLGNELYFTEIQYICLNKQSYHGDTKSASVQYFKYYMKKITTSDSRYTFSKMQKLFCNNMFGKHGESHRQLLNGSLEQTKQNIKQEVTEHSLFRTSKEANYQKQKSDMSNLTTSIMDLQAGNCRYWFIQSINDFVNEFPPLYSVDQVRILARYVICGQVNIMILKPFEAQQTLKKIQAKEENPQNKKEEERKTFRKRRQLPSIKLPNQSQKMYNLGQFGIGILHDKKFHCYFQTERLQNNICNSKKKRLEIKSYLILRKGQGISYNFEILTYLFNQTVMKTTFSIHQLAKVTTSKARKGGKYYLTLSSPPHYQISFMETCHAYDRYHIGQWHRVQNFPILKNNFVRDANDLFLLMHLRSNTTLQIDLVGNNESFEEMGNILLVFMSALKFQQSKEKVQKKTTLQSVQNSLNYSTFQNLLDCASIPESSTVFDIKLMLLCFIQRNSITFGDAINFLEQISSDLSLLSTYWTVLNKINSTLLKFRGATDFTVWILQKVYKLIKHRKQLFQAKQKPKHEYKFLPISQWVKIPNIKLTPSGVVFSQHTIELRNRILKHFHEYDFQFLKVEIQDDDGNRLSPSDYLTKQFIRPQLDQIKIFNRKYIPLGWSQSQLRNSSIWYICESLPGKHITRDQVLNFLGDFSKVKRNPALRAARMGQSFSSSWTYDSTYLRSHTIRDSHAQISKLLYTDGIGGISQNVIEEIRSQMNIPDLCAIQIRYRGAKGMLALNPTLPDDTIQLRDSMVKFQCNSPQSLKYLDILEWNKYKVGYLNRQIIVLLTILNIPDEVFLALQKIYLKEIIELNALEERVSEYLSNSINNHYSVRDQTYEVIFKCAFSQQIGIDHKQPYFQGILQAAKELAVSQLKTKARVKVNKSARVVGLIDQFKVLKKGQIYCTLKKSQGIRQNISGQVILTRNPCLLNSDVRLVKCVSDQILTSRFKQANLPNYFEKYFVNCIIFPQAGDPPLTAQISGSDLDGDIFFISWDPTLIPQFHNKAQILDEMMPQMQELEKDPTYYDMLDFFISYLNSNKLGRLANSHLIHADMKGADCHQCKQLGRIHGMAVDFPKKGYHFQVPQQLFARQYPHFMQKMYPAVSYKSKSVLGKLYDNCQLEYKRVNPYTLQKALYIFLNAEIDQLHFQNEEILCASKIIRKYDAEVAGLLQFYRLKNQFQLYTGKHVNENDRRTIENVLFLRKKYLDLFFQEFQIKDIRICKDISLSKLGNQQYLPNVSEQIFRKILLWYLCSHAFIKVSWQEQSKGRLWNHRVQFNPLQRQRKFDFCGITWFCLPKLTLYLFKKVKINKCNSQQSNGIVLATDDSLIVT